MRVLVLLTGCLALGGCALMMPWPDPAQAWIDLNPPVPRSLRATEVDRQQWDDHRYFQVQPGAHQLSMRYRFEVEAHNIGPNSPPHERDCLIRLDYGQFAAGQRYSLEVGQVGFRPRVRLYDAERRELARGQESGCRGT